MLKSSTSPSPWPALAMVRQWWRTFTATKIQCGDRIDLVEQISVMAMVLYKEEEDEVVYDNVLLTAVDAVVSRRLRRTPQHARHEHQ
ncbi:hypothetical protein R1flu_023228 [Riccia fluitans]|uniref:Uncharacterized protein n=1 Tax=Riccia fluitans TaxID=41844 RepID=A0ABD1XUF0_9MARC